MKKIGWADDETESWLATHWPQGTRRAVAREVRRLQKGDRPLAYRPLSSFGSHVGELKRGQLRVVYTTEIAGYVSIVCAFRKDAKQGDAMRPEHERAIQRGLRILRSGRIIEGVRSMRELH